MTKVKGESIEMKTFEPTWNSLSRHQMPQWLQDANFGCTDFIPHFTAPKFDAEEWAQLFKDSGAKFAGPVAVHHDNFAMWKSKVNPWNSSASGLYSRRPQVQLSVAALPMRNWTLPLLKLAGDYPDYMF